MVVCLRDSDIFVELVDLSPEAENELFLQLIDVLPRLHILFREHFFTKIHPECFGEARGIVVIKFVYWTSIGVRALSYQLLILEDEPDELVVLVRKDVERMFEVVTVLIRILSDTNLGGRMLELFNWWRVLISNRELIVSPERPFEIWTSRYSFLRFDELAVANQII